MIHKIETTYHCIGAIVMAYGFVLMVKAAGLADLGGDLSELARTGVCGVLAFGIGALLAGWRI